MLPSTNSTGVQPSNLADTTTTPVTDESTRTRFPPLADDYDIYSLNVIDLLDYLSELSFSRELKLTTARCYRRWLAAYLEEADHPDAKHVRYWVIPHSPEYYDLLMSATDRLEADKIAAAKRAENKTRTDQLDMFAMLSPNNPDTEAVARKDYEDRRRRQLQGIEKARADGKYVGRKPDLKKRASIASLLKAGQSYSSIQETLGCSRHLIADVKKEIDTFEPAQI